MSCLTWDQLCSAANQSFMLSGKVHQAGFVGYQPKSSTNCTKFHWCRVSLVPCLIKNTTFAKPNSSWEHYKIGPFKKYIAPIYSVYKMTIYYKTNEKNVITIQFFLM